MLLVGPKAGPPGLAQKPRDQLWAGRGWGGSGVFEANTRAVGLDPKWPQFGGRFAQCQIRTIHGT